MVGSGGALKENPSGVGSQGKAPGAGPIPSLSLEHRLVLPAFFPGGLEQQE